MTTLQGTNISPTTALSKMMFLFPRWDMLVPSRVSDYHHAAIIILGLTTRQAAPFSEALLQFASQESQGVEVQDFPVWVDPISK